MNDVHYFDFQYRVEIDVKASSAGMAHRYALELIMEVEDSIEKAWEDIAEERGESKAHLTWQMRAKPFHELVELPNE